MKNSKNIFKASLLISTTIILFAFDLPNGWIIAGDSPAKYEMGIDKGAGQDGKNAGTIKSIDKSIMGFGTLMQQCRPNSFAGKKIKMTASVRSLQVTDWAGLWLRVDQSGSTQPLSFDNMQDRPITGTTAWKRYEIILDVPSNASNMAFGALLSGTGQIWFDNITFEVIGDAGPANLMKPRSIQDVPSNLDFENE